MLNPKQLDELARRFTENLPAGVREFQQEMEKNVKTAMQAAFSRMDLVTREEFDAQAKVLARTRAQLDEMQSQVEALEKKLKTKSSGSSRSSSGGTGSSKGSGSAKKS